jgi:two-component system C4-dicarboxylate transport sensor histidine kinase DctB
MSIESLKALSQEIFYETDLRGNIINISDGAYNLLGFYAEDLKGKPLDSIYKYSALRKTIEDNSLCGASAEDVSVTLIGRSGVEVNALETVFVVRDRLGKPIGFEGIIRKVHCQDYMSFNGGNGYQKVLQNIIDSLPSAVCWKDKSLKYIGCNRSFIDLTGLSTSEAIIGNSDEMLFNGEDLTRFSKGDRDLVQGRCTSFNYVETVYIKSTGEFRWFDITKTVVKNDQGKFTGIVSIHDDITTWVNAELGIQNRLWFEQQIMEISAGFINLSADEIDSGINSALEKIGVFIEAERCILMMLDKASMQCTLSHDWYIDDINSIGNKIKTISLSDMPFLAEKLRDREVLHIRSVEDFTECSMFEQSYLKAIEAKSLIVVPMIKESEPIGFMSYASITKQREWDNDIISLLTIVSEILVNVLDRKYMQEELMGLYSKMEERVRSEVERNMENKKLLIQQSKLAAMGEMLGNIAHQWRQPLNALNLSFFELKYVKEAGELTDDKLNDILGRVSLLIQQMSSTVDDFRNFFKENKEQSVFLLEDSVRKALYLVQAFFEEQRIKTDIQSEGELFVKGFPNELSQVFLNIFNNSKDAFADTMSPAPCITVRLFSDNKKAIAEIEDNAGGIKEEILDRVFEPYFTTKSEGKGTGIGLYMSKMIVENSMVGKLSVRNTGDGVCFRIELPLFN